MEINEQFDQFFRAQMESDKKDKIERFRHLNKFVRPGQILFVGSSLMEQFPVHELMEDLDVSYTIYNRGIGGFTTPELLDVLDVCVYDVKPKYIFINIGTNDMNGADFQEDELMARYEEILMNIKEHLPEAKIYMLAYYPVNTEVGMSGNPFMAEIFKYRTNERVSSANRAVAALAEKVGASYIDVNQGLTDEQGYLKKEYTIEGMHMYADGYEVILKNLILILNTLD